LRQNPTRMSVNLLLRGNLKLLAWRSMGEIEPIKFGIWGGVGGQGRRRKKYLEYDLFRVPDNLRHWEHRQRAESELRRRPVLEEAHKRRRGVIITT